MDEIQIIDRLEGAFKTLRCLPDYNRHKVVKTCWPEYQYDDSEVWFNYNRYDAVLPRHTPSPREITEMEDVLFNWFPLIRVPDDAELTKRYRKVMAARSMPMGWRKVAAQVGKCPKTCQRDFMICVINLKVLLGRKNIGV